MFDLFIYIKNNDSVYLLRLFVGWMSDSVIQQKQCYLSVGLCYHATLDNLIRPTPKT